MMFILKHCQASSWSEDTKSGLSTPMTNGRHWNMGKENQSEPSASTLVDCTLDNLVVAWISDLAREGEGKGRDDLAGVSASVKNKDWSSESDERI